MAAKRKQRLFYCDLEWGCCLVAAYSLPSARKQARHDHGTTHIRHLRRATQNDLDWIKGMGGYIPANCVVDRA